MKLELGTFEVNGITLGRTTEFSKGELQVDVDELRSLVLNDGHFADVRVHVTRPGESVRIVHALDVVEPRFKVSGPGCVFPGVIGPPVQVGEGQTHRLGGMALVTAGAPVEGEPIYWREAVIDMSGPGASYSPFSQTVNLVLELIGREASSSVAAADLEVRNVIRGSKYAQEHNIAVRLAEFKVASYLAQATQDLTPDIVDVYELKEVDPSLPKVACAGEVFGEFMYGAPLGWQPTLLHPNELMDGVVYRAFNTPASVRNVTYSFQNHPIVDDMYSRHGRDLNFLGVLLYQAGGEKLEEKERVTSYASNLLKLVGTDGAVLTWIGGGHLCVDFMLLCRKCEKLGIKTSILNPEMARTPEDTGFVYFVPEADAIVSTGNYEQQLSLPPVDQVIGGDTLLVSGLDAAGPLTVSIGQILGATSPLGLARLTGAQY
ncbi:MAG: glycine/sarcosine/betaine reductase component B subunit [Dehalococcoidia bacterium]